MNSPAISGTWDDLKLAEILEELKLDDNYEALRLNELEPLDLSQDKSGTDDELQLDKRNCIEIELDSDSEVEVLYNELKDRGYKCKVLTL